MKRYFSIILITFVILLGMLTPQVVNAQPKDERLVIVVDDYHLQYIGSDLLQGAFEGINNYFDTPETDYTIDIQVNTEEFNGTSLQGVDLLIIPNPGLDKDGQSNVDTDPGDGDGEEKPNLDNYVLGGGNILYMSNPFTYDRNITGHIVPMSELFVDGLGVTMRLGGGASDPDNTTVIIDHEFNDGNFSHVMLDSTNFEPLTIVEEIAPVNDILLYSAAIDETITGTYYGNTSATAYPINARGAASVEQIGTTRWMSGNVIEDAGKAMLVGSTIMFSDLPYNDTSTWIEQVDNKELFQNLLAFMLDVTPLNPPAETVDDGFNYFFGRNVFYAITISAIFIGGLTAYFVYTGRLEISRILDIRRSKTLSSKKASTSKDTSSEETSKTTKPKKKKRRKRT